MSNGYRGQAESRMASSRRSLGSGTVRALLVAGFSVFATERADQEDKIEGMRHYGSDLRNILRERSQVSVEQACGILR